MTDAEATNVEYVTLSWAVTMTTKTRYEGVKVPADTLRALIAEHRPAWSNELIGESLDDLIGRYGVEDAYQAILAGALAAAGDPESVDVSDVSYEHEDLEHDAGELAECEEDCDECGEKESDCTCCVECAEAECVCEE